MKKMILIAMFTFMVMLSVLPNATYAAIEDGKYSINYQVNKPDSSSASMANDYFMKPATVIVENGKMFVQLTIKNSSWVTEFKPSAGGSKVISSNKASDRRTVQFNLPSFGANRVNMTVDIDDINYHHSYDTDFIFFEDSLKLIEAAKKPEQPKTEPKDKEVEKEKEKEPAKKPSSPSQNSSDTSTSSNAKPPASSNSNANSNTNSQPNSQVVTNQQNNNASDSKEDEETIVDEEETTVDEGEQTSDIESAEEEVENPETADAFPFVALFMLAAAILLYFLTNSNKKLFN